MAKQNSLAVLRVAFVLAFTTYSYGQTSLQQKADKSNCSNIVALVGSANINCSTLTPAQEKMLKEIRSIVSQILTKQIDSEKLTAMVAASKPSGDIVQQQSLGDNSPNINQHSAGDNSPNTVNINSDRKVTAPLPLKRGTTPSPEVWVSCAGGDAEQQNLAMSLVSALQTAGWNGELGAMNEFTKPFRGTQVRSTAADRGVAEELASSLNSIGLKAEAVVVSPSGQGLPDGGGLTIVIGAKP